MNKSKRKSRKALWIAAALCLAGAGAGVYWRLHSREVIPVVQTEKAAPRSITELVIANGKIQPVLQVVINPEVSGEIIELPVKEGQLVKKGDLLVRIKPDNYQAQRNSAEAMYKSALAAKTLAQANLNKAQIELKRASDLSASHLLSESDLLEAQTSCAVMQATFENSTHQAEQAAAALAKAEDDLSKTAIYAPMSGSVTRLRSQIGERVVGTALMAGTEIMTVADLDLMEARVDIGEVDVVLIQTGQVARLEVDAFRERKFSGRVTEIANSAKSAGSTSASSASQSASQADATKFEVKIRIVDREPFRPGMSVTAEVETRYRSNVLTVPIQSVTTRLPKKPGETNGRPGLIVGTVQAASNAPNKAADKKEKPVEVVFVLEGDHVKAVPVKRGISDDSYVEITSGISNGVEVISGGYKAINRDLEDGKHVKVGPPEEKPEEAEKK